MSKRKRPTYLAKPSTPSAGQAGPNQHASGPSPDIPDRLRLLRAAHEAGHAITIEVCENMKLGPTFIQTGTDEIGHLYHGMSEYQSLDMNEEGATRDTAARLLISSSGRLAQEMTVEDLRYEDAFAWMNDYAVSHAHANNYFRDHGATYESQCVQGAGQAVDLADRLAAQVLTANVQALLATTKLICLTGTASADAVRDAVDRAGRVGAARWLDQLSELLTSLCRSFV